ncbi:RNA polymerase II-associated protein 1 isoform X2 [Lycorma delicatula]|uniref:RNA polymerase II-associated protein 1 isoform X2 n=1 Tax=Lycorma delicatula TaxID=130591 RepID=UPI003F516370
MIHLKLILKRKWKLRYTVAHELSKHYPGMGDIEEDKIKWMEELPKPVPPPPDVPYNARFSFDGTLLPFVDDKLDVRQGLHHHGEEPERPGYSLQELIQLSRSSVLQQRIIALNTLANVLEKANLYVECFDKPLLPMLLDAELFLMLRFSLDDASRPVITVSLAALCNLLVNHFDEICLDSLLGVHGGIHQPSLHTVIDLKQNELDELKDPELLRLDVIRGALRTHLLPRFRYIFIKMNPEQTEIVHILKCLIRISRHSFEAAFAVVSCPGLLDSVRSLLTKDSINYYPDALKLLRVISSRTENFACLMLEKYSIMDAVMQILAGDTKERQPEAIRLMLESFYMWQTLLNYNLATDHISAFIPVISRLLCVHIEHTGMESSVGDQEHAVALLTTMATGFKVSYHRTKSLLPQVVQAAQKWTSQITNFNSITRSMCKLVGAALTCVAVAINIEAVNTSIETKLELYFQSSLFTKAISLVRKYSWLLSNEIYKYKSNSTDNLPSLAALPPTVEQHCTLPLLEGLAAFVLAVNKIKLSDLFLRNPAWENYLNALIRKVKLGQAASHWFARQEIRLICALLFININSQTIESNLLHHVSLVLSTIIHNDDKPLLSEILHKTIFNQQFFMKHILSLSAQIEDLQLANNVKKNSMLLEAVNNLEEIKRCYELELGLEPYVPTGPPLTLTATEKGCEAALPSDWQFLPILRLYNTEGKGDDAVIIATCSLQWVLILEHFQPEVASITPITARFCRLCCMFMAGCDLFRDVSDLLKELLKTLMTQNQRLDLDGSVLGLSSFYDFYRQLVDHYVAVSYGDSVFGQYILIPLQQCYNVKFRKLIWSEQAPLVRVLSTPVEQLVVPLEEFLEPCETDVRLLATYLQFLATERIRPQWSPVLYKVAVHHVSTFMIKYPENNFTKSLKQRIDALGNQEMRKLLLEYSQ